MGQRRLSDSYQGKVNNLSLQLSKINSRKEKLYENLVEGILDEEEYQFAKGKYEEEYIRLQETLKEAKRAKESLDKVLTMDDDWMIAIREIKDQTELTREMVELMIHQIRIFENKRIEIDLNYQQNIEEVEEIINQLKEAITDG